MTGERKAFKAALFIYFNFELILSACPMFGWPSLVYILRREGYYDYLCQQTTTKARRTAAVKIKEPTLTTTITVATTEGSALLRKRKSTLSTKPTSNKTGSRTHLSHVLGCYKQEERLNGAFIINIIVGSVTYFPASILVQKFGPRTSRVISSILFFLSGLTWIFASNKLPFLLYLASLLFSTAGALSGFTLLQVIAVVYDKYQSTVLSFGTSSYGASVGILVLLKLMYDSNPRLNFLAALGAYSGFVASMIFISTLTIVPSCTEYRKLLTTRSSQTPNEESLNNSEKNQSIVEQHSSKPLAHTTDKFITELKRFKKSADSDDLVLSQNTDMDTGPDIHQNGVQEFFSNHKTEDKAHTEEKVSNVTTAKTKDKIDTNCGFRESFLSVLYFWELLYISVNMTRMYFYVSAFDNLVSKLTEKITTLSVYTNLWGTFQFGGLILGPMLGAYVDGKLSLRRRATKQNGERTKQQPTENLESVSIHEKHEGTVLQKLRIFQKLQRCTVALAAANTVGIIMEITVLIPVLQLQFISMLGQVASREFMYAVHFSYLAAAFPPKHYGKLASLALVFGCGVSLIQYPLLYGYLKR